MPLSVGNIELFMGPKQVGAPDDLEKPIIDFIDSVDSTLEIAVQELESVSIAKAILRARKRRVRVRLVIERDYLSERSPVDDPWVEDEDNNNIDNRKIYAALLRAKVHVITDLNPNIFHQKFMVKDWRTSGKTQVLTGSTNFTPTGTSVNLNHIVIITSKRTAKVYRREFEELWSGTFGQKRSRHQPKPSVYQISNVPVKILFAPDHSPEMEVMKQMLKAKRRIDFAIFTFATSSGIDDAMIAIQRGNIAVRGVLDLGQGNQKWAASRPLVVEGVELYLARRTGGVKKLHHKLMVIDEQLIIAGSFNYTEPATALNGKNRGHREFERGRPRQDPPPKTVGGICTNRDRPHHQHQRQTVRLTKPISLNSGSGTLSGRLK